MLLQQKDPKGQGHIGQNGPRVTAADPQLLGHLKKRDDIHLLGQHQGGNEQHKQDLLSLKLHFSKGIGSQHAGQNDQRRGDR